MVLHVNKKINVSLIGPRYLAEEHVFRVSIKKFSWTNDEIFEG